MPEHENLYVCPQTRAPLELRGDAYVCADRSYPLRNGIPQFLQLDTTIDDPDEHDKLQRLLKISADRGWLEALKDVYGEASPMFRYVTNDARAKFLDLLPLTPDAKVLEIGPGLGQ